MKNARDLINDCDPTDANFCMNALDAGRNLAKWAQIAVDTNNSNMHLGRDDSRELAMAVLKFGALIKAFDSCSYKFGSPSAKEAGDFRRMIIQ